MKPIKIKIGKEVTIYSCPKKLRRLIRKETTFINPEWEQNRIMKRWNGNTAKYIKSHQYGKKSITVPSGFFDDLIKLFKKTKTKYQIFDQRINSPINFQFLGQLKPLQVPAVKNMLNHDCGILEAATAAGKTVMGLNIFASIGQKVLIIVHTKNLMEQWFSRAQTFLNVSKTEIGIIGDNYCRLGRRITIGIADSVLKHIDELSKEFGCIFVDECHRSPSYTFNTILSSSYAKYKFGVSATPFRDDGLTILIYWYIGPKRHTISKQKLIDNKDILQPKYIIRSSVFEPKPSMTKSGYHYVLDSLIKNKKRNRLICKDVRKEIKNGHMCIVLSDRKKHCHILKKMLKKTYKIDAEILTGEHKGKERRYVTNKLDKKETLCLIATGQLIGEGADFKHLSALFLTTPISFAGRLIQYVGRVMRYDKNKKQPLVYDYIDWEVPMLAKSGRKRIKEYGAENIKHK